MRAAQLEAWVLSIIDVVAAKGHVEDSRVELKREWPDPVKAARRIAGHANAARGDDVLWIIGLDEVTGVVPVDPLELSTWLPPVQAAFDGIPATIQDLVVPTANGIVIALLIDSSRVPYVVKNPQFGTSTGHVISLEVPWREGTSVRSARREDLLRLLVPIQQLPQLEALLFRVNMQSVKGPPSTSPVNDAVEVQVEAQIYVTPTSDRRVVIPFHKCSLDMGRSAADITFHSDVRLSAPTRGAINARRTDSHTIASSSFEAIVDGPGMLEIADYRRYPSMELPQWDALYAHLTAIPTGSDRAIHLEHELAFRKGTPIQRTWSLNASDVDH